MSTLVYKNAKFEVNGTDLSPDVSELALNYSSEMLDETAMGDDTRIRKGGLKDWSVDVKFHQDHASGHVGALLFALVGSTTCVELRPQNTCTTSINPSYSGVAVLANFPPLGGAVGSLLDAGASFVSAGTLSRASSS